MGTKFLYFLSFAVCLISSCTSNAPDDPAGGKGTEVSFTVSDLSRASVTSDINIPGSKFAVYGDMKNSGDKNAAPVVVFNKTEVEYLNNSWNYNNTQYWFSNHEHSFVAIYPLSVLEPDNTPQYSDSGLSFTYALPTSDGTKVNRNDVSDILAATHRRLYSEGSALPVSFRFSHILSLVNIAFALDDNIMDSDTYMQFRKLELSGFKTKASFNIQPAPRLSGDQTDDRVIEVTAQEGDANLTIEFADPKKIMNHGGHVNLFDDNDAIIMLPQAFDSDSQAKIILTYTLNDDNRTKQLSIPLELLEWVSCKSYLYRFTLSSTGLIFGKTVITDWEETKAGDINAY